MYRSDTKGFYLQWDGVAASRLHYYGPFYGVPLRRLGGSRNPAEEGKEADSLRFSETQELVLAMGSTKFMLDFDTGQTMDPPQTLRPEQELMDVCTDQVQGYHYPTKLVGLSLQGREVKASDWDASVSDVLDACCR